MSSLLFIDNINSKCKQTHKNELCQKEKQPNQFNAKEIKIDINTNEEVVPNMNMRQPKEMYSLYGREKLNECEFKTLIYKRKENKIYIVSILIQ